VPYDRPGIEELSFEQSRSPVCRAGFSVEIAPRPWWARPGQPSAALWSTSGEHRRWAAPTTSKWELDERAG